MSLNIKNFAETKAKNGINVAMYEKHDDGTYSDFYAFIPNADTAQRQKEMYGIEPRAVSTVKTDEKTGKKYAIIKLLLEYKPAQKPDADAPADAPANEKKAKKKKPTLDEVNDDELPF